MARLGNQEQIATFTLMVALLRDGRQEVPMTDAKFATQVTRDAILMLLTDAEVAKVSTAESMPTMPNGEEYVDLERLDLGVQRTAEGSKITMGHVVPRGAVSSETWRKIAACLTR